jgi:hypothetical protein
MSIFRDGSYKRIESKVKNLIGKEKTFLSPSTVGSTRAIGDAIQNIITRRFQDIAEDCCKKYSADFARRAMADLAFEDNEGKYYLVDVKTHNVDTQFNMPNLTSVHRLATLYSNNEYIEKDFFCLLIVQYKTDDLDVKVRAVHFVPIENLDWNCLTIGALGWGQIQIANSRNIVINRGLKRKTWMLQLCDELEQFYPKEIVKIRERIEFFKGIRRYWQKWPGR